MRLSLVAAVAANGVIGADGAVPWDLPADLAHFRRTTTGHPVILGRRTFDAVRRRLDGPLPDRTSVVLTSRPTALPDDVVAVGSVDAARAAAAEALAPGVETAYVAGGASVYEQFLPLADELLLSELPDAYEGDARFPAVEWDAWTLASREPREGFAVARYVRAASPDEAVGSGRSPPPPSSPSPPASAGSGGPAPEPDDRDAGGDAG